MRSDPVELALRNIERMIDRDPLLRDILHPSLPTATRRSRFVPPVDVIETDAGWTILMELPGVPRADVHVRLDGTKLVVRGTKPGPPEGRVPVHEREGGPFVREFVIPFTVEPEGIVARLEDGVLRIALPRAGKEMGRDVPVEG